MKKFYLLSIFNILSVVVFAQITLEPNPSVNADFEFSDFEVVGYTTVTNTGSETANYTWTRTIVAMTEGWLCAICDINLCYMTSVSTQTFQLPSGGEGNLDVHVYPNNIAGSAIVELEVVDNDNPDNSVTGTYLFDQLLNTAERLTERVKIYPNPVVDLINFEGTYDVSRVEIYNIEGKLVHSDFLNGNNVLNVSNLVTGTYVLRMWDADNQPVSSNVLIKQ